MVVRFLFASPGYNHRTIVTGKCYDGRMEGSDFRQAFQCLVTDRHGVQFGRVGDLGEPGKQGVGPLETLEALRCLDRGGGIVSARCPSSSSSRRVWTERETDKEVEAGPLEVKGKVEIISDPHRDDYQHPGGQPGRCQPAAKTSKDAGHHNGG